MILMQNSTIFNAKFIIVFFLSPLSVSGEEAAASASAETCIFQYKKEQFSITNE